MPGRDLFVRTLAVHWTALRWPLALAAVLAFALPLVWMVPAVALVGSYPPETAAYFWLRGEVAVEWTRLFPLFATATGAFVALGVWYWDHRGEHVYALSLPVGRPRYVLVKMAVGGLLVCGVAVAFYVGALAATTRLDLPEILNAYPGRLAAKFLLAMLLVYGLVFALAAGTIPTALKTITVLAIIILVGSAAFVFDPSLGATASELIEGAARAISGWPGPFAVLGGDWGLVGV